MYYAMNNEDLQEAIDELLNALQGNTVPSTGEILRTRLDELLGLQVKRAEVIMEEGPEVVLGNSFGGISLL